MSRVYNYYYRPPWLYGIHSDSSHECSGFKSWEGRLLDRRLWARAPFSECFCRTSSRSRCSYRPMERGCTEREEASQHVASHDGTRDVSLLEGARTVRIHSPVSDGLAYLAMVSHCACVTAYEHTHIGPQVITSSRELTRAG